MANKQGRLGRPPGSRDREWSLRRSLNAGGARPRLGGRPGNGNGRRGPRIGRPDLRQDVQFRRGLESIAGNLVLQDRQLAVDYREEIYRTKARTLVRGAAAEASAQERLAAVDLAYRMADRVHGKPVMVLAPVSPDEAALDALGLRLQGTADEALAQELDRLALLGRLLDVTPSPPAPAAPAGRSRRRVR